MSTSGSTLREVGGAATTMLRMTSDQHRRTHHVDRGAGTFVEPHRSHEPDSAGALRAAHRSEAETHRRSTAIQPRAAGTPPGTTRHAPRDSHRDAGAAHAAQPPAQRTDTTTTYATTKGRSPAGERTDRTERENQGRRAPARKTAGTSEEGREA